MACVVHTWEMRSAMAPGTCFCGSVAYGGGKPVPSKNEKIDFWDIIYHHEHDFDFPESHVTRRLFDVEHLGK